MAKNTSFWEPAFFSDPYDLIVVGAGIVGLSTSLFYRKQHPGARILVLDRGALPEGASTRNAGFACVGSISEHVADMEKETEENIKKRLHQRYRGLHTLRTTLGEDAIGYENCGGYELFTAQETFRKAKSHIPLFNQWMQEISGREQVYRPAELNGYPVICNPLEGALHPGRMMSRLADRVTQAGIAIRWKTPVESIGSDGTVRTGEEITFKGRQVLMAGNGFSCRLCEELAVQPARGMVVVSEPWPGIPWRGTFSHDRGYIYFRNVGDRLLLGGGRNLAAEEETRDEFGINETIRTHLHAFARKVLHMPPAVGLDYEWSGIMGFTPTKTPIVKRLDEHRVVAAGLSGMGIAIGMDIGRQAAGLLE